jgi:rubrerythrin
MEQMMSSASHYFNTLAAIERAVTSGHFNIAKVLRAVAHVQQAVALDHARSKTSSEALSESMKNFVATDYRIDTSDGVPVEATSRMNEIVERSLKSLESNEDVSESDVAQSLWGCTNCGNVVEHERPDACDLCGVLAPEFKGFGPFFSGTVSGNLKPKDIIRILEEAADETVEIVSEVDERMLSNKPDPTEWSAKETLAHMLETDGLFVARIEFILNGDGSKEFPSPMPPWKLHEGKGYNEMESGVVLDRYLANRRHSMEILRSLSEADWAKQVGSQSLLALGTWASTHDRGHMEQLRRACRTD